MDSAKREINNIREKINLFIAKDDLAPAIEIMLLMTGANSKHHATLSSISGRLKRLDNERSKGGISFENYTRNKNNIINSFIQLSHEIIPEMEIQGKNNLDNTRFNIGIKKGAIFMIITLFLVSFVYTGRTTESTFSKHIERKNHFSVMKEINPIWLFTWTSEKRQMYYDCINIIEGDSYYGWDGMEEIALKKYENILVLDIGEEREMRKIDLQKRIKKKVLKKI